MRQQHIFLIFKFKSLSLVCGPCLPQLWIISTTYFLPMGHIQVKYTTHWTLTSSSNMLHIMGKHITTWLWEERDCRGSKSGCGDLCDYSRVVTLFPKGELAVTPWRLCNHLMPLATHNQDSPSFKLGWKLKHQLYMRLRMSKVSTYKFVKKTKQDV